MTPNLPTAMDAAPANVPPAAPVNAPDWLGLAREAYSTSTSYFDANIRNQIVADLRQFQSEHGAGSKYHSDAYKARSRLFRPKTRSTIRKNEASCAQAFFSTADVVSISAENPSDATHRASADLMQALLQYRLTKSVPWFLLLNGAYQDAQTVGLVASYQEWEYDPVRGIDRPRVELLPIENLRFDPAANWTNVVATSPYLIRLMPMYLKDVQARMTVPDPKTGKPKWRTLGEDVIRSAARRSADSIRLTREGHRTDPTDQANAITAFTIVWVHQVFMEVDGMDYVYYTLGTEALLSDPVPMSMVYPIGERPIVVGYAVLETHKLYPSSVPKLGRDIQNELNDLANLRNDNVRFVLNKRYFVKRGKQVDLRSLTRNVPGSATLMQDTDDVKVVETADVTRSAYEEQDRLNLDFDEIAGSFSQSSVQSNRRLNETVGGMNILDAKGNQLDAYQLRIFTETWVEPVLRQLMRLEQHYETDEVILALAAQRAQLFERFGIDGLTDDLLMKDLVLTVNVGIGAVNPKELADQFMQAMNGLKTLLAGGELQQYGLQVQEVVKELFGKLGYKDGARFFKWDNQDPQVVALQQQVQQLTQALQAKADPALVAAQVQEIGARIRRIDAETVKLGVTASYEAMQAGEVVAAIPQVAPVADAIMQGAGYQPPGGANPHFPQPGQAVPGLQAQPISNPRTGIRMFPANTDPMTPANPPAPATGGQGEAAGIETPRADGTQHYAGGGLVGTYDPAEADSAYWANGGPDGGAQGVRDYMQSQAYATVANMATQASHDSNSVAGLQHFHPLDPWAAERHAWQYGMAHGVNLQPQQGFARGGLVAVPPQYMVDPRWFMPGMPGYATGGLVMGPGTGTSDSVPASIDGQQPAALSKGEYVVPADVVAMLGPDYFEQLVATVRQSEAEQGIPVPPEATGGAGASVQPPDNEVQQ